MKICFVGNAGNIHTIKLCRWFADRGHEVHVVSFAQAEIENVQTHYVPVKAQMHDSYLKKTAYLFQAGRLRREIEAVRPDVVNVHYATGYGITMALSGVKKYVLSVWGSDVYAFPNVSPLHRALLRFSLARASALFSTSEAMAEETSKYTGKPIKITPFGVDAELFSPEKRNRAADDGRYVVGTVKTLEENYGIDYLIRAVAQLRRERPDIPVFLRIAGKGRKETEYRALAEEMGIADRTTFLGFIPQTEVAVEWANMDCAVVPSARFESFGVAAVEAQACGTAVVVTDIAGLREATAPGESSVVVEKANTEALARAIAALYDDPERRKAMGNRGRENVLEKYEINGCFRRFETYLKDFAGV